MNQAKKCLITGATSGIGRAAADALAGRGYHLLLVARSREKGESLQLSLQQSSPASTSELFLADLSSQASVRAVAAEINARHRAIDVLLNNAGGIFGNRQVTQDGIELTFGLNHLGYFLLTNLLLDTLKRAGSSRIINVSSNVHKFAKLNFGDLNSTQSYHPLQAYANSKLANVLFTYELARRLNGSSLTVNALHPGGVRTNFGRELPGAVGAFFRHFGFLLRSPGKGAETAVWLADSSDVEGITGKYFLDRRQVRTSAASYDAAAAKRLWDASAEMTGLD